MACLFPTDDAVEALGRSVLELSLPKAEWTHAAHLAVTAWLVRTRDAGLEGDLPGIIRRYNLSTGVANTDTTGYHETITQASLGAVRAFLAEPYEDAALHEACNRLIGSAYGRTDWLLAYWSRPRLFSVEARRGWLKSDLAELPFTISVAPCAVR